jgi:hypothetical protein
MDIKINTSLLYFTDSLSVDLLNVEFVSVSSGWKLAAAIANVHLGRNHLLAGLQSMGD